MRYTVDSLYPGFVQPAPEVQLSSAPLMFISLICRLAHLNCRYHVVLSAVLTYTFSCIKRRRHELALFTGKCHSNPGDVTGR